jgi:hypothetical protein
LAQSKVGNTEGERKLTPNQGHPYK